MKRPLALSFLFAAYVLFAFVTPTHDTSMNVEAFGALPVLNGGRIKPLDTVARVSLLLVHGKQTLDAGERRLSAIEWLMDMLFRSEQANTYACVRIDDPDVLGLLRLPQKSPPQYSFVALAPSLATIEAQANDADQLKPEARNAFQRAIVQLQSKLVLYQKLQNTLRPAGVDEFAGFLISPNVEEAHRRQHLQFLAHVAEFLAQPVADEKGGFEWRSVGEAALRAGGEPPLGVIAYARMGDAYRQFDPSSFNAALAQEQEWLRDRTPDAVARARREVLFNRVQPFMKSLIIYLAAALLVFLSWLRRSTRYVRAATELVVLAFIVHTAGLVTRMVLQGRPPVTNLYSSAIFIGWASVLLGLFLERTYRNSIGILVSATMGFLTMIIAHNLASSGDTLEMMRAVLDTNFWLATHVVCVTVGYSATFLAGLLAVIAILRKFLQKDWPPAEQQAIETMVFGVVCFATFFSFLGTILGGIWADQSWGRFWGWDPKENGALLIVLWNAFTLHARKLGFARGLKLMMLAVAGNIITAFSWFGVNMLGIGLHSYGFMEEAFVWLLAFIGTQLAVIGLGFYLDHPLRKKRRVIS